MQSREGYFETSTLISIFWASFASLEEERRMMGLFSRSTDKAKRSGRGKTDDWVSEDRGDKEDEDEGE